LLATVPGCFIEVIFSEHPDPAGRDYLKRLPTSFALTDEAVNRLIDAVREILRNNRNTGGCCLPAM